MKIIKPSVRIMDVFNGLDAGRGALNPGWADSMGKKEGQLG